MSRKTRLGEIRTDWEQITARLEAHAEDLPHLEKQRGMLQGLLAEFRSLTNQQDQFKSQKQQVSKRLQEVVEEGQKLSTFLRAGIRQHYGNRSEKLVEFGVQPFRGRQRELKAKPAKPAPADQES
ncbi:MAG TPA: hypothetical protein VMW27_14930 [Thermoanaerobaculia bacterium]|nr:hypothetical protein [Thermoanaerobaculia bacterium]